MLGIIGVVIGIVILAAIGSFVWYIYMKIRFRTVPSNEALIVTGTRLGDPKKDSNVYQDNQGRSMKVIRGGGHLLRLFQNAVRVSLSSVMIQLNSPKVYTKEGVGIFGKATATIKVADTLEGIVKYAEQFLGKSQKDISSELQRVLDVNLRAILSKMTVEEINQDGEAFNEQVRIIAQKQLDRMGFTITSFGLSDLEDDNGYLENLGKPQIAIIKKEAEIAESENERITEMKRAEDQEAVKREQYAREMNIAEAKRDKDIKEANFLAQTEKERAVAEAVYDLEKEQRRKIIVNESLEIKRNEKTVNLELTQLERENDVKLEEQQVDVRKFQDDTEFYTKTRQAEAEANAKLAEGKSKAQVIRLTSDAEAEAIEKRAEAMSKHDNVALREKLIEIMPEYAKAISDSMNNIESVRILDGGSGDQLNSIPSMVTKLMANSQESIEQMTGLNITDAIKSVTGLEIDEKDVKDLDIGKALENISDDDKESIAKAISNNITPEPPIDTPTEKPVNNNNQDNNSFKDVDFSNVNPAKIIEDKVNKWNKDNTKK